MNDMVYVVLVNYCHPEVTIECVESIRKSKGIRYKILIVDNDSPDDSINILQQCHGEDVVILKAEKNEGFSSGNNVGIRYALCEGARYILLLNNDTIIAITNATPAFK